MLDSATFSVEDEPVTPIPPSLSDIPESKRVSTDTTLPQLSLLFSADDNAVRTSAARALAGLPGALEYLISSLSSTDTETVLSSLSVIGMMYAHTPALTAGIADVSIALTSLLSKPQTTQAILIGAAHCICQCATSADNILALRSNFECLLALLDDEPMRPLVFCAAARALATIARMFSHQYVVADI